MEQLTLRPVENQKMYFQIIHTFIEMIREGKLTYGQKLYREQELVNMLNVSRPTLREALRVLEFLGIVTTRPRRGIIINDPSHRDGYFPLEMILTFERTDKQDLFELRRAIEIENAGNAALRATDKELEELKEIDELLEETGFETEVFEAVHRQFHLHISKCSGNNLNFRLLNSVMVLINRQVTNVYSKLSENDQETVRRSHRSIASAIVSRNKERSQELMRQHMNFEPMIEVMYHLP